MPCTNQRCRASFIYYSSQITVSFPSAINTTFFTCLYTLDSHNYNLLQAFSKKFQAYPNFYGYALEIIFIFFSSARVIHHKSHPKALSNIRCHLHYLPKAYPLLRHKAAQKYDFLCKQVQILSALQAGGHHIDMPISARYNKSYIHPSSAYGIFRQAVIAVLI